MRASRLLPIVQAPTMNNSSARKMPPITMPNGRYCRKSLAQLREIDVEHHDDEQEQHRDRADINDDQDHREKFGAHQHEQPGGVDEGEDQEQHRMHRDCARRSP